jgi:hypothetical protein
MNKRLGQKLLRLADTIEQNSFLGNLKLGAGKRPPDEGYVYNGEDSFDMSHRTDIRDRVYPSVYIADAIKEAATDQYVAQINVSRRFGLAWEQVAKLDKVAASTHNLVQRGQRVANFLRRVVANPNYIGINRRPTTGAVAASL